MPCDKFIQIRGIKNYICFLATVANQRIKNFLLSSTLIFAMKADRVRNFYVLGVTLSLLVISYLYFFNIRLWEAEEQETRKIVAIQNLLTARVQPRNGKNIFFLDTSRMEAKREINARQACSIESAARANPHLKVFLSIVSPRQSTEYLELFPVLRAVESYGNVHFNSINLLEFARGTLLENFVRRGELQLSEFVVSHTSDALRYLILWKYGGTYLDADVIVKKRLDSFPMNYACDELTDSVNGAVLNLVGNVGRKVARMFLKDLIKNYDRNVWVSSGPELITRNLGKLCGTNDTSEMILKGECQGFHVLHSNVCYPEPWDAWQRLFNETVADEVLKKSRKSMTVHFWNNLSSSKMLKKNSKAAYIRLAEKHCPKVFAASHTYF